MNGFAADFPLPFRIVPQLMVAFGCYAVVGLPLLNYWVQSQLYYALTDKRVIVFLDGPFGRTKSQALAKLPALELVEQAGARGSIMFCPKQDNFTRG